MEDSNNCEDNNEVKRTRKDQNHRKKEQFRGSRLNQKTLVESSIDKDADESDSDPEDGNIPLIVEDLVASTDESENGGNTENSDVPITIQDKREIDDEHETPIFYGPLKSSTSLQSIRQQSNSRDEETERDGRNTSDEEFPEFLPDKTTSKQNRRGTITRQEEKECSSDDTDTSDLIVTDREYYSIRHETEYQIESQREFIVSDDEVEKPKEQETALQQDEDAEEDDNDTDTSELEVTNKEYYTIRHETEASVRKEKEFIISFSPKRNMIRMQSCDETSNLGDPWKPATDLFRVDDDKDEETTDDDISCDEEDFMTFDEFMEAHKTNYSFKI